MELCVKVCIVFLLPEQLYWTGGNAPTGLGCTFYFIFSCSPILSWPRRALRSISNSSIPPVPAVGCSQVFCSRHERLGHVYLNKWAVISQLSCWHHTGLLFTAQCENLPGKAVSPSETEGRMATDFRDINQARGVTGRVPALSLSWCLNSMNKLTYSSSERE